MTDLLGGKPPWMETGKLAKVSSKYAIQSFNEYLFCTYYVSDTMKIQQWPKYETVTFTKLTLLEETNIKYTKEINTY